MVKRGVSPILSLVILIALIVGAYSIVYDTINNDIGKKEKIVETTSQIPLYCEDVSFSIKGLSRNGEINEVQINIENNGAFNIEKFTINRETENIATQFCNLNINLEPGGKKMVNVSLYSNFSEVFFNCPLRELILGQDCVRIRKLSLTPWINLNGNEVSCDNRRVFVDNNILNNFCDINEQCNDGENRPCYSGPNGTEGIGECVGGEEMCIGGSWSGNCINEITPRGEDCGFDGTGNGLDENCDGTPDNGCIVWNSTIFEIEQDIETQIYDHCDCSNAGYGPILYGPYNGQYPRCDWFLHPDQSPFDCDRDWKDGIDCHKANPGSSDPVERVGHCSFVQLPPGTIAGNPPQAWDYGDRYFGFEWDLNQPQVPDSLNESECNITVAINIGSVRPDMTNQDYENLFISVNNITKIYLDDVAGGEQWVNKTLGPYLAGSFVKGINIIQIGNPKEPQEIHPDGSSIKVDWIKVYCYIP